jgi:glycosyltransferase involved in cell wall biosynthesis
MAASERYKGHDQILEALPRVLELCPNVHLVVAGEGDDRRRLEEKADYLGIGAAVLFAGFTSEATLAELYRRCAVFVMPSRGEGFGLVYLEAMRAARPVVAALGSAAEEIVVDGETGLLVDPDDRERLARTLARLLRDAGGARRMGWAGRERWERELGLDRFRERLEPLLERLVSF